MSDETLQFDSVVPPPLPLGATAVPAGVTCAACRAEIQDDYFDANGQTVCHACHNRLVEHAAPAKGWGTLVRAALFGAGAAFAGALLYYAVIAITDLEIGFVAIAIGYMVGYSVRAGARGRGSRRLQVLAVVLTYLSVSLAYGILTVRTAIRDGRQTAKTAPAQAGEGGVNAPVATSAATTSPAEPVVAPSREPGPKTESRGSAILALGFLAGLWLALPVLVIFGSLPGGLLSGAIIGFGLMQAWKLTGVPQLNLSGPYRVAPASAQP